MARRVVLLRPGNDQPDIDNGHSHMLRDVLRMCADSTSPEESGLVLPRNVSDAHIDNISTSVLHQQREPTFEDRISLSAMHTEDQGSLSPPTGGTGHPLQGRGGQCS